MAPGSLATGLFLLPLKLEYILEAAVWCSQQPLSQLFCSIDSAGTKAPSGEWLLLELLNPPWLKGSIELTLLAASEKWLNIPGLLLWLPKSGILGISSSFGFRVGQFLGRTVKEVLLPSLTLPFSIYLSCWEACRLAFSIPRWATIFPSMGSWL